MNSSNDVRAALGEAERVRQAVNDSSKWYARYLTIFGIGTAIAVATIGLIRGPVSASLWALLWAAFVTGISLWALRQPVQGRGIGLVHGITLTAVLVLYSPVLALGVMLLEHIWWWYAAAAPAVALPLFVGAYYWAVRR